MRLKISWQTVVHTRDSLPCRQIGLLLLLVGLLSPQVAVGQPFNDNWNAPGSGLAFPFGTTGNNINATVQPGEQNLTSPTTGSTVWWFFQAPANGNVTINTNGSNFDTVLHVFTGNVFGSFTLVASNDDSVGLQSSVTFPVSLGQCYEVRVGGFSGAQGNITLTGSASGPANDNWSLSGTGLVFPFATTGNNIGATTQPLEQNLTSPPTGATAWWIFNAGSTGPMTINTFGSNFDTVLHVYSNSANGFGNFTLLASNDDSGGTLQSSVTFTADAGFRYEIRVGGFNGAQGNILMQSDPPPPPPPANDNWALAGFFLSPPFSIEATNVGATVQPMEQNVVFTGATVWWFTQAPGDGVLTIDTFGSDFDTVLDVYNNIGNGFGNFTLVASNDDFNGLQSQVMFPVNAGQCYEIRVGGFFGLMGNIDLTGVFMPGGVLLGDVNLDGVVSLLDVSPFVNRITSGTYQAEADINEDGVVSLIDVAPFVTLLTGG